MQQILDFCIIFFNFNNVFPWNLLLIRMTIHRSDISIYIVLKIGIDNNTLISDIYLLSEPILQFNPIVYN